MKNDLAQQKIIEELQKALLKEVEFIRQNPRKTTDEKIVQVDVLFDTMKFLKDYEENIKILNQYYLNKSKDR